ncbi:NADH-quinone oxidoreductase subunit H [Novosphingobium sp. MW5]|nr:NADH-quinone oxidoreductase subunit H [Novosphingobium sp. MW5]
MFVVFFISALAETNRPPFDLAEAESELVAGFMVEYGSTPYMMFMLGEYVAISLMCALMTIFFMGGWLPPFDFRNRSPGCRAWSGSCPGACLASSCSPWWKAMVPRYRYDQLMRLGWKVFLPLSLGMVVRRRRCKRWSRSGAGRGVSISLAGVIGAAIGLYVGWLDYRILKGMLQAAETKNRQAGGDGGAAARRQGAVERGDFRGTGDRLSDHRLLGRQCRQAG